MRAVKDWCHQVVAEVAQQHRIPHTSNMFLIYFHFFFSRCSLMFFLILNILSVCEEPIWGNPDTDVFRSSAKPQCNNPHQLGITTSVPATSLFRFGIEEMVVYGVASSVIHHAVKLTWSCKYNDILWNSKFNCGFRPTAYTRESRPSNNM